MEDGLRFGGPRADPCTESVRFASKVGGLSGRASAQHVLSSDEQSVRAVLSRKQRGGEKGPIVFLVDRACVGNLV